MNGRVYRTIYEDQDVVSGLYFHTVDRILSVLAYQLNDTASPSYIELDDFRRRLEKALKRWGPQNPEPLTSLMKDSLHLSQYRDTVLALQNKQADDMLECIQQVRVIFVFI
jgi:hypothetical protein